jgi:thioesterase domain-containing protein
MRSCPICDQKLVLSSRNKFCSSTCSDSFRREEARWEELSSVDSNTTSGKASGTKEEAEDDAAQFIWASIRATANYIRKSQPLLLQPRREVIKLKEGSTEVPLYFIGGLLTELRLSQMMKVDRAIYAVEVPWPAAWHHAAKRNETAILPDMEGLAALYTKALLTHIRSSRCVLAGFSFCGLIAFEVAHQLSNAGLKVEMVMLLDSQAIYPSPRRAAWQKLINDWRNYQTRKSLPRRFVGAARLLPKIYPTIYSLVLAVARSSVRLVLNRIIPGSRYPTTKLGDDGIPWQFASIERVYARAERPYRLRPLDCKGVLFRTNSRREKLISAIGGSLGWNELFAKGLEIKQMSGDHLSIVKQHPHDLALASEMSRTLQESRPLPNSITLIEGGNSPAVAREGR